VVAYCATLGDQWLPIGSRPVADRLQLAHN
jgi:hypothetical protein